MRTARVSKAFSTTQVVLGLQVPLRETGTHSLHLSLSPVHASSSTGAPLSVTVLDAGQYEVVVEEGAEERRANSAAQGADVVVAAYSEGIRLKEEPNCLFRMQTSGLEPVEPLVCRVMGDSQGLRPLNEAGEPLYANGDCTHTPSAPGSCCDRKHWWQGLEYDNYPVIFNFSVNCPTTFDPSGSTIVAIVWHEGESNAVLNTNVYQVSADIIQKFWPDEPECPWYGWETQLNDVILRELPQDRDPSSRACPRRRWLSGYVGGVDLSR